MKHCRWCENDFNSDISYQIYCSPECREAATKEKISQRYLISRRQRRLGKNRRCKMCEEKLSIYNDDILCTKCNISPSEVSKALKQIKGNSK